MKSDAVFLNTIVWSGDVSLVMDDGARRTFFVLRLGVIRHKTPDLRRALDLYDSEVGRCVGCGE